MSVLAFSLVTVPLAKSGLGEFWLSNVHPLEGYWGFNLCGPQKKFIARFVYHDEQQARRAVIELGAALQGAAFISTAPA